MLSYPGKDFRGGSFYVAHRLDDTAEADNINSRPFVPVVLRRQVPLHCQGDLAIFKAAKSSGWFHGMDTVEVGSSGRAYREAIGLLQPK
eukprot:scaffold35095_cov33-Prasinocladus_malaysianus.AAC.1